MIDKNKVETIIVCIAAAIIIICETFGIAKVTDMIAGSVVAIGAGLILSEWYFKPKNAEVKP